MWKEITSNNQKNHFKKVMQKIHKKGNFQRSTKTLHRSYCLENIDTEPDNITANLNQAYIYIYIYKILL